MTIQNITPGNTQAPTGLPAQQADAAAPQDVQDKVTISGEKSLAGKIFSIPKNIAKAVVGSTFAVASAVVHTPAGTIEGIDEGLCQQMDDIDTGWFTGVTMGEFTLGGAAAGWCIGGPVGAGIGAGIGLLAGGLVRAIEGKAGFPERFVGKVEKAVDEAVKDNQSQSKIREVTQNLTEGALTGTIVGFKESLKEGYSAGAGVVDGVCDVLLGLAQGIRDAFKKN